MDNNMNPFNGGNGNGSGNGSQGPNGSGGSEQNNPRRTSLILLAIAAIVTLISMSLFMRMINNATNQEITYGKFQELVEDGKAAEVTWDDDTIYLKLQQTNQKTLFSAMPEVTYYTGKAQSDDALTAYLKEYKVASYGKDVPDSSGLILTMILTYVLPIVVMWLLLSLLFRRMGGGGPMGVGKSNAKVYVQKETGITFKDVAGEDEAKESLQEVVDFLHNPQRYVKIGAKLPKGALLVGPPGTGKTLLAKAVAGEAKVPFFSLTGSDFIELYVGVGASRVRDLFKEATKNAPCIIFIDEIDAIGRSRDSKYGGGNEEREQTLNQLLSEMDGFDTSKGILVLGATNRPEILDKALLRPGRFDRQIVVSYPDIKGREEVLKVHTRNKPLAPDVNLKTIAQTTVGFTGADLENLVNEASLLAARADRKAITKEDIEEATIKVVAGPEKKSRVVTEREKKLTSYHEAGHAICTYYCPSQDKVHQVSIIPRGMAGGFTMSLPEHDKSYMSKTEMYENIVTLLGGRVAEKLILDDISTGASNDLERATSIARNMVTRYGFSEKLGPMVYGNDQSEVFLGRDFNSNRNYSENVAAEIDAEMREIIEGGYQKSKDILEEHMDQLHLLAKYLMKFEKIDSNDFEILMKGEMDSKVFENSPEDTKTEENSEPESTNVTNENSTKTEE